MKRCAEIVRRMDAKRESAVGGVGSVAGGGIGEGGDGGRSVVPGNPNIRALRRSNGCSSSASVAASDELWFYRYRISAGSSTVANPLSDSVSKTVSISPAGTDRKHLSASSSNYDKQRSSAAPSEYYTADSRTPSLYCRYSAARITPLPLFVRDSREIVQPPTRPPPYQQPSTPPSPPTQQPNTGTAENSPCTPGCDESTVFRAGS